jgi:polyferredoxin
MSPRLALDLLANRSARRLLRTAAFPLLLQILALAGVVALAWNGWGIGSDASAAELKTLRKTNLTTLFVWGLWWPGMIVTALLLGRVWCTFCPMELANRLGDAAARALRLPRARLGKALRAGWAVVAAYLTLQLLVAGAAIHRVPHFTALVLLALLGTALAAGLAFAEGRAFCKAFCPAGALLSVYGRFTPVGLDVRDPGVCARCEGRACVAAAGRDRLDRRSCPSHLRPFARAASDGCVLCLQCAKVCPERNVGLGVVAANAPQRRPSLLRPAEAAFVMVASGFVTHELAGEVAWVDAIFHRVPDAAAALLGVAAGGWTEAAWFLVAFPALLWSAVALAARLAGPRAGGVGAILVPAATAAAPVIAVAHLAKALAKLASWGAFLPGALRDPRGLATFEALRTKVVVSPGALADLPQIGAVTIVGVALLAVWSWRRSVAAPAARIAIGVTGALMIAVLVAWTRA